MVLPEINVYCINLPSSHFVAMHVHGMRLADCVGDTK